MQSAKVKKYSDEYLILVWRDDEKRGAQKMGMKIEHTGGNFVFYKVLKEDNLKAYIRVLHSTLYNEN